ncbi:MAG: protein translocase SEC61 complex subunit gamma [Thermoproteota archaeon]
MSRTNGGLLKALSSTLKEWKLVLQRVRKPDMRDYRQAAKVIWLAILLVGAIAYVIHLVAVMLLMG